MVDSNITLNAEQRIAIEVFDSPMALLAGAGSGKTRVLVERYVKMLERGVQAEKILAVTFTNEAANELKNRIISTLKEKNASQKILESVENSPWIGTIHSFCYKIFDTYGSLLGNSRVKTITSDFEIAALFAKEYDVWLENLPDNTYQNLLKYFNPRDLYEIAESLIFQYPHFLKNLKLLKENDNLGNKMIKRLEILLRPLVQKVKKELEDQGSYTFNDLEVYTYRIFHEFPQTVARVKSEIDYILIDEFQDTSRLQWDILRPIIAEDFKNLFIVGDPKQSIYGFRHAEVELFSEICEQIRNLNGVVQNLSYNFRTGKNLLKDLNELSANLFDMSKVPFQAMKAGKSENSFNLEVKEYCGQELNRSDWQELELEAVIQEIKSLRKDGVSLDSITLLFRNSDRIKEYKEALEFEGFKTYTELTTSLFDTYDILDIVHYINAIHKPEDDYSLAGFLRSSYISIPESVFSNLLQKRSLNKTSLFQILKEENIKSLNWFFCLLETKPEKTSVILEALFSNTEKFPEFYEGFFKILGPLLKEDSLTNAVGLFKYWKKQGVLVKRTIGSKENSIRLMTVHASKGLEFSHVILADALRTPPKRQPPLLVIPGKPLGLKYKGEEESNYSESYEMLLGSIKSRDEEESKRILYVAMTRAMNRLYLFLPKGMKTLPKGSWADLLSKSLKEKGPATRGVERQVPLISTDPAIRTTAEPNPLP